MRFFLILTFLACSASGFSQVTLSLNKTPPDPRIKEGFWQADDSTALGLGYNPYNNDPSIMYYKFDVEENEYVIQNTFPLKTYFTSINKADKTYHFISIANDRDASSFFTLNFYFDNVGNWILRQLNFNQASFSATSDFFNYVQEHVANENFLGAGYKGMEYKYSNRKKITDLEKPSRYKNLPAKKKPTKLPDIQIARISKSNNISPVNLSQVYDKHETINVITFVMPFIGCPPCDTEVGQIYTENRRIFNDRLATTGSDTYFHYSVISCVNKENEIGKHNLNTVALKRGWKDLPDFYLDEDFVLAGMLSIKGFPTTIVVNNAGDILYQKSGAADVKAFMDKLSDIDKSLKAAKAK